MGDLGDPAVLVYTVPEVAKLLRKGRNQIYELIARGELPAIRLGTSIRVPKAAIDRLLEGQPAAPERGTRPAGERSV